LTLQKSGARTLASSCRADHVCPCRGPLSSPQRERGRSKPTTSSATAGARHCRRTESTDARRKESRRARQSFPGPEARMLAGSSRADGVVNHCRRADACRQQSRRSIASSVIVGAPLARPPFGRSPAAVRPTASPSLPASRCSPAAVAPIDRVLRHCGRPTCSPSLPTKSRGPWPLTLHILGELGRSLAAVRPTASSIIAGAPMLAGSSRADRLRRP